MLADNNVISCKRIELVSKAFILLEFQINLNNIVVPDVVSPSCIMDLKKKKSLT